MLPVPLLIITSVSVNVTINNFFNNAASLESIDLSKLVKQSLSPVQLRIGIGIGFCRDHPQVSVICRCG
jgi:hypothetical protein